jgi:hypothetical protein
MRRIGNEGKYGMAVGIIEIYLWKYIPPWEGRGSENNAEIPALSTKEVSSLNLYQLSFAEDAIRRFQELGKHTQECS